MTSAGIGIRNIGNYNTIGGCSSEYRNVIVGTEFECGIEISGGYQSRIVGNYIGLSATGGELIWKTMVSR